MISSPPLISADVVAGEKSTTRLEKEKTNVRAPAATAGDEKALEPKWLGEEGDNDDATVQRPQG